MLLLIALIFVAVLEITQLSNSQSRKQVEVTREAAITEKVIQGETATVAHVIDGDTIELTDGRRVRYIGIDAPEIIYEDKSTECFGIEAKEENSKLVQGKKVRLESDFSETDNYGRLLRYVYVSDTLVNKGLVQGGFARAWNVPPDEKYKDTLFISQQEAKEARRGLWQLCR